MGRAVALLLAICMVAFAAMAIPVQATAPEGPRITVLANVYAEQGRDLITMGPSGESPEAVIKEAGWSRPSWSADGSLLTFGGYGGWSGEVVAVAEANGSGLRFYRRASLEGGNPVMAPDGHTIAYLHKGSVWLLNVISGSVRRATPWRLQAPFEPSSFSPDGSKLAGTIFAGAGISSAVAVDLRTGRTSLLANEASEPVYSPDGSEVAFIRWKNWRTSWVDDGSPPIDELRVTRVGNFPRSRLVRRSHKLLAWPSWDPSGHRLAFTRTRVIENGYDDPMKGDALMAINTDGTCLKKVYSDRETTLYGAAWQPGPGREAGPISC
jgi:Tol biopolymer transport system component